MTRRRIHVAKDIDGGPWTPLPFWRSPFPYVWIVVFALLVLVVGLARADWPTDWQPIEQNIPPCSEEARLLSAVVVLANSVFQTTGDAAEHRCCWVRTVPYFESWFYSERADVSLIRVLRPEEWNDHDPPVWDPGDERKAPATLLTFVVEILGLWGETASPCWREWGGPYGLRTLELGQNAGIAAAQNYNFKMVLRTTTVAVSATVLDAWIESQTGGPMRRSVP